MIKQTGQKKDAEMLAEIQARNPDWQVKFEIPDRADEIVDNWYDEWAELPGCSSAISLGQFIARKLLAEGVIK